MAMLLVASLLLAAIQARLGLAASCYQSFKQAEFPNCMQLDPSYVVHWRVDNLTQTITFGTDVDGFASWFAIGVSEGGLKGFDMAIMVRGAQAQTWIPGDYFSVDENPILDLNQDVTMSLAPVMDKTNRTTSIFTRPLDSCDTEDVPVVYNTERSLIWAYGYGKWEQQKATFFNVTTQGTVRGLNLWPNPNATLASLPSDSANLTLAMPAYPVPAVNTTLVCTNLPVPTDRPYHAVRYEGTANSSLVHHFNAFACAPGVVPPQPVGTVYDCPKVLPVGCETLHFVWGPGSAAFTAPPQAGFPFGAGAAAYYVLQVHYQNPGRAVVTDRSSFQVSYTPTLRNATLGVLTLGTNDIVVPPNQERYQVAPNTCPASCTGMRLAPTSPVTLVSNFFIMGPKGTAVLTRHLRGGQALQPLGSRSFFDSRFTGFQQIPASSAMLSANDTLITICSFNTSGEPKYNTTFGLLPAQEICYNYVTFYPATAMPGLDICIANPRKNTSTCTTRTRMAAAQAANMTDVQQIRNGSIVQFKQAEVKPWKSLLCRIKEGEDITPRRAPNTRGAIASIITVVLVLSGVGLTLYYKFQRKEEMEALLAEIRRAQSI